MAEACNITRQEQDEFALQSQLKCTHAMGLGHYDAEIEPIILLTPKGMLMRVEAIDIFQYVHKTYYIFFIFYKVIFKLKKMNIHVQE